MAAAIIGESKIPKINEIISGISESFLMFYPDFVL